MNIRNTELDKKRFFANYYGVKCFQNTENLKYGYEPYSNPIWQYDDEFCILNSVENVTDEHLEQLLFTIVNIIGIDGLIKPNSKELTKEVILNYNKVDSLFMLPSNCVDKLRELGYAVDWNGYNIREQLKLGWIKFT